MRRAAIGQFFSTIKSRMRESSPGNSARRARRFSLWACVSRIESSSVPHLCIVGVAAAILTRDSRGIKSFMTRWKKPNGFLRKAASNASASNFTLSSLPLIWSRTCRARTRPPTMPGGLPDGLPDWPGRNLFGVCCEQAISGDSFMADILHPAPRNRPKIAVRCPLAGFWLAVRVGGRVGGAARLGGA